MFSCMFIPVRPGELCSEGTGAVTFDIGADSVSENNIEFDHPIINGGTQNPYPFKLTTVWEVRMCFNAGKVWAQF